MLKAPVRAAIARVHGALVALAQAAQDLEAGRPLASAGTDEDVVDLLEAGLETSVRDYRTLIAPGLDAA
jgi:hypothetical protein